MSDLIYRDELKRTIKALVKGEVQQLLRIIDGQPKVDAKIEQHGCWILTQKISENAFRYNCSECNRWVQDGAGKNPSDRFPYCHCGAKMDRKENEE